MTPSRKSYLAKCSKREKFLRVKIKEEKKIIRANKYAIQTLPRIPNLDLEQASKWVCNYKRNIAEALLMLSYYRHELNHFKGMDRAVVPKVKFSVPQIRERGRTGRKSYYATCKCGNDTLYSGNDERYCPQCGRRILWEKVK